MVQSYSQESQEFSLPKALFKLNSYDDPEDNKFDADKLSGVNEMTRVCRSFLKINYMRHRSSLAHHLAMGL